MTNKFNPSPRKFFKRNFKDLLDIVTPEIYKIEDFNLSGEGLSETNKIINSHIDIANNINSVISISSINDSDSQNLNDISGISKYFVKQNNFNITPFSFERNFLIPLNNSLANFNSSGEFYNYLSSTFIPLTRLATESDSSNLESNLATLSSLTSEGTAESVHNFLCRNLGWFYFLNTSADGGLSWEPSGYVAQSLATLFNGNTIGTLEGIKGLTKYVWNNYETCSTFKNLGLIPTTFVSGAADAILDASDGTPAKYTSGTQKLDNLETLLEVIYSPYKIDEKDFYVKDAFDTFISIGSKITDTSIEGPFTKFQEAMGFSMADITEQIENIGFLYDIANVNEDYLRYIADLIGWKLKGAFPSKWRHQLRNAVEIYKKKGTLDSIQLAIDSLITETVLDVSGKAQELWESYLPFIVWYSLGTASPYFKTLNTWTLDNAFKSGVIVHNSKSLEANLKIVTDTILLRAYKKFPELFNFKNKPWPVNKLVNLDDQGKETTLYTVFNEPGEKPYYILKTTDPGYQSIKQLAYDRGEKLEFDNSFSLGPLGEGHYLATPTASLNPVYLKSVGDVNFVFNYRDHINFPIPPFEEVKYYQDCSINTNLISFIKSELRCFGVESSFLELFESFLLNSTEKQNTSLNSLNNEFLFFFSSLQLPPNYDSVVSSISEYQNNLLPLWNGKSSHLFIDFEELDFTFGTTTIEGEGKYALQNISKIAQEFAPGHAVVRANYNLSAENEYYPEYTYSEYVKLNPKDVGYVNYSKAAESDLTKNYTASAVLKGYEVSGSNVFAKDGREGLPTFKRSQADDNKDLPFFSSVDELGLPSVDVPRNNLRRRNFRGILPIDGYYDRTGFNGPVTFDPSVLENSNTSSLNVLTLGYIPSAGQFYPVVDAATPSGVWAYCENLNSSRTFSGVDTSNTFPFRGLNVLGSDSKMPEITSSIDKYVDRGQTTPIIAKMHSVFERIAQRYAENYIKENDDALSISDSINAISVDSNWKNIIQSEANKFIASGLIVNSFSDYENFKFGSGLHKLYKNYTQDFGQHATNDLNETGATIIAHTFSKGLFNCDFDIAGSAATGYIASSLDSASAITKTNSGYFIASSDGDTVVPVNKPFSQGTANHAELRNPHILSGIEFVDTSGSSENNKFFIFNIDKSFKTNFSENYLIENTVIKFKTVNSFPRIRFDLNSYGQRLDKDGNTISTGNKFIKDHDFELRLNALIADETKQEYGGGSVGVWIHTKPVNGMFWSWTPNNKWEMTKENTLQLSQVKDQLAHIYSFNVEVPPLADQGTCLLDIKNPTVDTGLNTVTKSFLKQITIPFNTKNFTKFTNLEAVPEIPEEFYKYQQQLHGDSTQYVVEIFFLKPPSNSKYLLLDSVELQDMTLREWAGVPLGFGEESQRPNMPFVDEDTVELEKDELYEILKFFNGIIVPRRVDATNVTYFNPIPSRTLVAGDSLLETSGGSRLNYRLSPYWHIHEKNALDDNSLNATNYSFQVSSVTFIN